MNRQLSLTSGPFESARLLASDYDGSMFATFEPSPNGLGVKEAYMRAVSQVFSFDEEAVDRYVADGGHQNRTPTEIAFSLAPQSTPKEVKHLGEELVNAKLEILLDQVGQPLQDGTPWPRPVAGFPETWHRVTLARAAGHQVCTAIISAGHTEFIQKSFDVADLELPDFMVTDETVRGLCTSLPLDKLTKPSILPMDLIRAQWLSMYAATEEEKEALLRTNPNSRILYIGDDPIKDAQLARNANVQFIQIEEEAPSRAWEEVIQVLNLGSLAVQGAANETYDK